MGATFTQEEINLRELANITKCLPAEVSSNDLKVTWFIGDAIKTVFTVTEGFIPFQVFEAGLLQKDGDSDEYTVTDNKVIFAVAPAVGVDVVIYSKGLPL